MTSFGIGQAVRRKEDARFLEGAGRYVDDIVLPRQAYGAPLMSSFAHARIKRIDVSAAQAAPGVIAVLTGVDHEKDGLGGIPPFFMPAAWGGPPGFATKRPALIKDIVRCVGDRIAYVIAESASEARDALGLIEVEYEELPAVTNLDDAVLPDAPRVWSECETGNIGTTLAFGDKDGVEKAFASARHVVKLKLLNNRLAASAIEPRSSIGHYDSTVQRYTLYTSSQDPHGYRHVLAGDVFGCPETSIRVIAPDVGGGFGIKACVYPDDVLVLWASKRVGRPVKWTATRAESLLLDTQARDQVIFGEMALDDTGKILAVRAKAYHALGAYWSGAITSPLYFSMMLIPSVYDIQLVDVQTQPVFTHTIPTSVYRGAGRPEAMYFMERMLDRAAQETGIDRIELRKKNLIKPDAFPYHTPTHLNYDSGDFAGLLEKARELSDWDGFEARRKKSEKVGKLRGRSLIMFIEVGGVFNERMEIRFDPSGSVSIIAGTHSHGQGHETAFSQLVSEWLGVPFESIRYVQGDTEQVQIGRGTFAARSSMVGGCALRIAADAVIERARKMASILLEASEGDVEFKDGLFKVGGTDKAIPITEVAKVFYAPAGPVVKLGLGLDGVGSYHGSPGGAPNFPNGCQICEAEVDPETGVVNIASLISVDDLGMVINPMIVEGQIHGGIAQGLGQALLENVVYDRNSGQLLTGTFMDYGIPRADICPDIISATIEIPATTNPLGIKGIGESGTIGAPPAIVNAVLDALLPVGVKEIDMPLTPFRVWQAINAARQQN